MNLGQAVALFKLPHAVSLLTRGVIFQFQPSRPSCSLIKSNMKRSKHPFACEEVGCRWPFTWPSESGGPWNLEWSSTASKHQAWLHSNWYRLLAGEYIEHSAVPFEGLYTTMPSESWLRHATITIWASVGSVNVGASVIVSWFHASPASHPWPYGIFLIPRLGITN